MSLEGRLLFYWNLLVQGNLVVQGNTFIFLICQKFSVRWELCSSGLFYHILSSILFFCLLFSSILISLFFRCFVCIFLPFAPRYICRLYPLSSLLYYFPLHINQ